MAACLITVSGTEGLIRLDYKIGVDSYYVETSIGTFYIEDTATDVTYTTLVGDLIASSGCLTVTELPAVCYKIEWSKLAMIDYHVSQIEIGSNTYSISGVTFPKTDMFGSVINDLNVNEVKCVGYKILNPTSVNNNQYNTLSYSTYYNGSYILKVLGTDIPVIKIADATNSNFIYIKGVEYICENIITDGYQTITPCYSTSTP